MKRIIVLLGLFALAALAADFTGAWVGKADLVVNGEKQTSPVYMTFQQDGSTVTGTAGQSKEEQSPIRNGKADGDTLTFEIQHGDDAPLMKVELKLDGDMLRGTAKSSGGSDEVHATLELTREKE